MSKPDLPFVWKTFVRITCPFVASWQFLLEFFLCESCYFSILGPILLKLHILAHLIKSFPTVYGLCSCIKEMLIPLAGKRFERCNFLVLRSVLLKNACFISAHLIESYPRESGSWSWAKEKLLIPLEAHSRAKFF